MLNKVEAFLKEFKKTQSECKEFCQNKSNPLKDRWEVFEKIGGHLGDDETYVVHFKSLPEEFVMYDGDYMHADRYQTIYTTSIIEHIEECQEDGDSQFSKINIDEVKEEILDKFLWSFKYDW